jgi:hypothetical protein
MKQIIKVGVSELRSRLASYLSSKEPIAIIRKGQILGYFVPATVSEDAVEKETLEQATAKLMEFLKQHS